LKHYFISDVHLGFGRDRNADRERERRLLALLEEILTEVRAGLVENVFIVGDLFDSWFEWGSVVPRRHVRTLAALASLAERTNVEYLMGNHDFGHRDFFATELGIPVHADDITRVLDGKRFYIAHGDGKAENDRGYLILKSILRNKLALRLYGLIHPDLGIPFAERISSGSRAYTDGRERLHAQDGMRKFAEHMLAATDYDFVIMGHRHKPEIVPISRGTYVNLGDWLQHYTYGVFDGAEFQLLQS
jgi:UDP-2,3-diacylglucosamine hydrolase